MASNFTTKISFIIKEIQDLIFDKINDAKTTIQNWCNGRFSLNTHNHDNSYDSKGSSALVQANLNVHDANTTKHITASERSTWNSKANGTHTHTISQITGLSAALAGKASTSHMHNLGDITGGVVGYPNWSSFQTLSINTQYTASRDGWLFYWIGPCPNSTSGSATLVINGHSVMIGYDTIYKYNYGNDCRSAVMYPIKSGDVYSVNVGGREEVVSMLRFYNCR